MYLCDSALAVMMWLLMWQKTEDPSDVTTAQRIQDREELLKQEMECWEEAMAIDNMLWNRVQQYLIPFMFIIVYCVMNFSLVKLQVWLHTRSRRPPLRHVPAPPPVPVIERRRRATFPGANAPRRRNYAIPNYPTRDFVKSNKTRPGIRPTYRPRLD